MNVDNNKDTPSKLEVDEAVVGKFIWDLPADIKGYLAIALHNCSPAEKEIFFKALGESLQAFLTGLVKATTETHLEKTIANLHKINEALRIMADKLEE